MGGNVAEDAADFALEEVRQFFVKLDEWVPVLGDFLEMILEWPEAKHERIYHLADQYEHAVQLYTDHLDDISGYLGDLDDWQGDGAAQIARDGLQSYLQELADMAQAIGGMHEITHSNALNIEAMKWMAVINLVMMAIALVQLLITAWTGVGAVLGASEIAGCRVAIKELASLLVKQLWEQTIKGGFKHFVQGGVRGIARNVGMAALKGGLAYAGFTLATKAGILAIQALEGHDPFEQGWVGQFVMEVVDSFIAGAIGGPLMLGVHMRVTEAVAFGTGQLVDNLLQIARDNLIEAAGGKEWAQRNGLWSGMTWSNIADSLTTAALLGEILTEPGGGHHGVANQLRVNVGAHALFGQHAPVHAPSPTVAPSTLPTMDGLAHTLPTQTGSLLSSTLSPTFSPTVSPTPSTVSSTPGTPASQSPGTTSSSSPGSRTPTPSSTSPTSTSPSSTTPSSTTTGPSRDQSTPTPTGPTPEPTIQHGASSTPTPDAPNVDAAEHSPTATETPQSPTVSHAPAPEATSTSSTPPTSSTPHSATPHTPSPSDGATGTGREEPRWWEWKKRMELRVELDYAHGVAQHFTSPGPVSGHADPAGRPLTSESVRQAMNTRPESLHRYGNRLRSFLEQHFTALDENGNRHPLSDVEIAAKLEQLRGEASHAPGTHTPQTPHPTESPEAPQPQPRQQPEGVVVQLPQSPHADWVAAAASPTPESHERARQLLGEVLDRQLGPGWSPTAEGTIRETAAMVRRVLSTTNSALSESHEGRRVRDFVRERLTHDVGGQAHPLSDVELGQRLGELFGATGPTPVPRPGPPAPAGHADPVPIGSVREIPQVFDRTYMHNAGLMRTETIVRQRLWLDFERFPVHEFPGGVNSPQARAATHRAAQLLVDAVHQRELDAITGWLTGETPASALTQMSRIPNTATAVMLPDGTLHVATSTVAYQQGRTDVAVDPRAPRPAGVPSRADRMANDPPPYHESIAEVMDSIPQDLRSAFHGRCAEPGILGEIAGRLEAPFRADFLSRAGVSTIGDLTPEQRAQYRTDLSAHLRTQLGGGQIASHVTGGPEAGREQYPCASDDLLINSLGLRSDYVDTVIQQSHVDAEHGVVALVPEGDPLRANVAAVRAANPNALVVVVHGEHGGDTFQARVGDLRLSHVELARVVQRLMADHEGLRGRTEVILLSCDSGRDLTNQSGATTGNFGADLSRRLGLDVYTPRTTVWINGEGRVHVGDTPPQPSTGQPSPEARSRPDFQDWQGHDRDGNPLGDRRTPDLFTDRDSHDGDGNWQRAEHDGTGGITATDVVGTPFVGHALSTPDPEGLRLEAIRQLSEVSQRVFGDVISSAELVTRDGREFFDVSLHNGAELTVRVDAVAMEPGIVARAFVNTTSDNHVIQLSDRMDHSQVGRALSHEIRELLAVRERAASGAPPPRGDMLRAGPADPTVLRLSDEDRGRLGEVDWLADRARDPSLTEDQRRQARDDFSALIDRLGLRNGAATGDPATRSGDEAAVRIRQTLARSHLNGPAVVALDDLARPIDELAPADARALAAHRALVAGATPGHPPPTSGHPVVDRNADGTPMTRDDLVEGARQAATLRDTRAAATLAQLRAEAEQLPDGRYPRRRVMIGGGAALAGRDPGVLLVDGRGRWHVDPIEGIVQSADQVRHLYQTGIGDPHQFAGPRERVPLEAIRLWEDTIAASGPVVDGHARLVLSPDGRLLAEVRPVDGSDPVLLEVDGEPLVATGIPPEIIPGCSPQVPRVPEALHVLRDHLVGVGTPEAVRAHTALSAPPPDATAAWAIRVLDDAGLVDTVRGSPFEPARLALQTLEATQAWDQARAAAPGRVLYGDEVGDGEYDPSLAREWLIGGIGGAAIANAEIILRANSSAHVSMVGTAAPWVLHNDAQYLALRRQHDAALGGDGRLTTFGGQRLGPIEVVDTGGGARFRAGGVEGDAYVACLGRVARMPQALDPLMAWALHNGGTVNGELMFDRHRQYLGYRLVFEAGGERHDVVVTGAASRMLPREIFSPADASRVAALGDQEAPPESGNVAAGFMATATQAVRLGAYLGAPRGP